jgi:hypothetical protein
MSVERIVAGGDAIRLDISRTSESAARSGDWRHIVAAIARSDHKGMQRIAAGDRRRNGTGTRAEAAKEPRRGEGFAMNIRFIVAAAFLLVALAFDSAAAAGPYDGEWKGTATSAGGRCRRAVISFTVDGTVVLGQAKFEGDTTAINGAVNETGAMGATIGFQSLRGRFTGVQFEGTFKFANCDWDAVLRRTGSEDGDHEAVSNGQKGRF